MINIRKCSPQTTTGYIISSLSAVVDGLSEGCSTGLSIFTSLTETRLPLHMKATIAATSGGVTSIIHAISNFCFQGSVTREIFSTKNELRGDDLEILYDDESISKKRKFSYLALKYGYCGFALVVVFFELFQLYSATKAFVNDLQKNEDIPVSDLTEIEIACLVIYYLFFDVPFILTNEITQSCKEITKRFNFAPDSLPDQSFLNLLKRIALPFAKSNFVRNFIQLTGSFTDTIEHVLPLVIIIPVPWILNFASQPLIYTVGGATIAIIGLTIVSGTIFAQTYLFEGKYSEENLKNIAWASRLDNEVEERWINEKFANFFHTLLYLGGPLHGIDSGLSVTLSLREMKMHPAFIYLAGALAFSIGWLGNHYSEVKESQESLKKITKSPSLAKLMSGSRSSRLYSVREIDYGTNAKHINTDDKEPLVKISRRLSV